jgi:hypothetical protein
MNYRRQPVVSTPMRKKVLDNLAGKVEIAVSTPAAPLPSMRNSVGFFIWSSL